MVQVTVVIVSLLLTSLVSECKVNPCDGEVFSVACKLLGAIREKVDAKDTGLKERLHNIDQARLHDTNAIKLQLAKDVHMLNKSEQSDIKIVTGLLEDKAKALNHLLTTKLKENERKIDRGFIRISGSIRHELSALKKDIFHKVGNKTKIGEEELDNLEAKIVEQMNISTHVVDGKFDNVREDFKARFKTLKEDLGNNINSTRTYLAKKIQINHASYGKGFKGLQSNINKTVTELRNVEGRITVFENKVDEEMIGLETDLSGSIAASQTELNRTMAKQIDDRYTKTMDQVSTVVNKSVFRLRDQIEREVHTKYHSLKKEMADDLASVAGSIAKDIRAIKLAIDDIKKSGGKGKGWPAGNYCVFKNGDCPTGFSLKRYKWVYYCCH